MIRQPVVAGQFYPGSRSSLERQIKEFVEDVERKEAIGLVCPHAGYIYSGPVAGAVISRIKFKETFVILGPNHTGTGEPFSIMTEGTWRTPLGDVEIDSPLAKEILQRSPHLSEDRAAHLYEHSIEVQIPFLQYFKKDIRIVPIVISHSSGATYKEIGKRMATALKELKKEAIIIASSDMTHYEPQEVAKKKDTEAINAILELNEDKLLKRIGDLDITMCGYGPTVVMLSCCKELGAKAASLVKYQTSGDTTGDYTSVVGYAGIIIT